LSASAGGQSPTPARPVVRPLANAITRGYHLYALPANRLRVATDWLNDVIEHRQFVQLGLIPSEYSGLTAAKHTDIHRQTDGQPLTASGKRQAREHRGLRDGGSCDAGQVEPGGQHAAQRRRVGQGHVQASGLQYPPAREERGNVISSPGQQRDMAANAASHPAARSATTAPNLPRPAVAAISPIPSPRRRRIQPHCIRAPRRERGPGRGSRCSVRPRPGRRQLATRAR